MVNDTQNNTRPVEQVFLDINEKSQLLEQADIFKGHCFKNYGNEYADELKSLWVALKKCAVEFTRWGFKDFDEYLYTYLLMAVNPKMPVNLSPNGKHYLDGKSIDETEAILNEMILYGTRAVEYHSNVSDTHYAFSDLCHDANNYANTGYIEILKQLSLRILESKGAQYQKLPLLFLVHKARQCAQDEAAWSFGDFQKIITNLYVYSTLFVLSGTRKSKSTIDHSLYDTLQNCPLLLNKVVTTAQSLRKKQVDSFDIPGNLCNFWALADLYTTMDYYVASANRISGSYLDNIKFTIEHFVIPDNKNTVIRWVRYSNEVKFSLSTSMKAFKKRTTNYIILPKELNEILQEFDIVTKIEKIKEYYQPANLPKHIATVISYIESLAGYHALLSLSEPIDEALLKQRYEEFVISYFSDINDGDLRSQLTTNYKNTFRNEVTN